MPPPKSPTRLTGSSTNVDSDFDIDAMIEEDQQHMRSTGPLPPSSPPPDSVRHTQLPPTDDDEQMFDELDAAFDYSAFEDTTAVEGTTQRSSAAVDDDEDMWDMVREIEMEESNKESESQPSHTTAAATATSATPDEPPRATNDEGWDDMYL